MIASLGMYDFGPAMAANDRLWAGIRDGLRADMVEVATRIHLVQVGAGGQQVAFHRHDREQQFERAGRAQQVAMHRLGRRHARSVRPCAEHVAQCGRLDHVAAIRRGGMRIDPEELRDQILDARERYRDLVKR